MPPFNWWLWTRDSTSLSYNCLVLSVRVDEGWYFEEAPRLADSRSVAQAGVCWKLPGDCCVHTWLWTTVLVICNVIFTVVFTIRSLTCSVHRLFFKKSLLEMDKCFVLEDTLWTHGAWSKKQTKKPIQSYPIDVLIGCGRYYSFDWMQSLGTSSCVVNTW